MRKVLSLSGYAAKVGGPNNYRGITINSCLSKLFNSILNNRLVIFLRENKILNNEQKRVQNSRSYFQIKNINL